ncbi:MAG: peptidylprolyl isomerase [Cytophagales bacterium]
MLRFLFLLSVCTIILSCSEKNEIFKNQAFEYQRDFNRDEISKILIDKDHRQGDSLKQFINSNDPDVQYELALAFASLQECELAALLLDKAPLIEYPTIRAMIYYAYGQSCRNTNTDKVLELAKYEKDSLAQVQLAEAIGKSSKSEDLVSFINKSNLFNDYAIARCLYQFSQRNVFYDKSIKKMVGLLEHRSSKVKMTASNMLARLKGEDLVNYAEKLIEVLKSDSSAGVRMNIATAFNKINGSRFAETLLEIALDSTENFRVRVNAINSLNYYHYETYAPELISLLDDSKLNIQLETGGYFLNRCERAEWNKIALLKDNSQNPQVKALIHEILLKFANKDEKQAVNSHILANMKNEIDPFAKSFYIKALKSWPDNYNILADIVLTSHDLVSKSNAMQAFFELSKAEMFKTIADYKVPKTRNKLISYFSRVFQMAILSGDPTLMGYGAKGLRNEEIDFVSHLENTDFIEVTMNNIPLPKDIETYIDLEKTMAFVQGKEIPKKRPPLNHFVDINQLKSFSSLKKARVNTNKGAFQMEFDHNIAPATVANFIELSQNGFYDSLRFHRVENNFVVQGGCPRGDGWGSSGESIRSEFGPKYYQTGSVGMASAGKDTESCQWFVTHYPSIHLDGSYTNFARVSDGMDVVFDLAVGDTILSIEILP